MSAPQFPGLGGSPDGSIAPDGQFTPGTPPGSAPNPYVDPGPWGTCTIGGYPLPGIIRDISGAEKLEEWATQKGTGTSGATTVWKGTKIAEGITITIDAPDPASFDGLYVLRDTLRPKLGTKPPTLAIVNPAINFCGVNAISVVSPGQPKPSSGNSWQLEVKLTESNPSKPANTGPAGPKQWEQNKKPSDPNDQAAADLQAAIDAAAKA